MKWIDKVLDDKNEIAMAFFWQLVGPLFILCTNALAPQNDFIFFAGVAGLFLSAKYRNAGFIASSIVLVLVAVAEHFYNHTFSIWEAGLEVSYGMAFFITAQSAARHQVFIRSLFSKIDTKNAFAKDLEDEFTKTRCEITNVQIHAQEKIDSLQKQLDEIHSEQSSLLVLNEVLRKTTATHMNRKETLTDELYQLQNRLQNEITEKETLKAKLVNTDLSAHHLLVEELDAVRREHEQTHTLKETLERLHNYEQQRAHVACLQLNAVEDEKNQLHQKVAHFERELSQVEELKAELAQTQSKFEALKTEKEKVQETLATFDEDRNSLKIKLAEAEAKLSQKEEKQSSNIELLYKQLRTQFEEKNATLHQARSELFKVDNAYQALQIEMSQIDIGIPRDVVLELQNEISSLQEENQDLQNIITRLSEPEVDGKKKPE
ncbi:MAG TPA: hypothetical protein VLE96_00375 [Chlamydiales bacterium]|nr:hypothetical protein [Chlamydiales bacterium]